MAKDRQSSWASGELTPDLHGQAGSPVYQKGAALLRNFMVTPQGLAINRSGTVHVKELPNKTTVKLVPFLFGDDPVRIAAIQGLNAGVVMLDADGELADPVNGSWSAGVGIGENSGDYDSDTLKGIRERVRKTRTAQCAGTMMLSGYQSPTNLWFADILRSNSTTYVRKNVSFDPPAFGSSEIPYSSANNRRDPALMTSRTGYTVKSHTGDATHPKRVWDYAVTRVVSIEDGNSDRPNQVIETRPRGWLITYGGAEEVRSPGRIDWTVDSAGVYTSGLPREIAVYGDWEMHIDVGGQAGDDWKEQSSGGKEGKIIAHRVYRGRDGVFGYLGETTSRVFVDDGRDPDIANPPAMGSAPLKIANFGGINYPPVALAFGDDRRFIGNLYGAESRVQASAVANWSDFQDVITPDAADAISFDLASNEHQAIRHLLKSAAMLAFTSRAVWSITGSGEFGVLTPTDIAARKVLQVGSAHYPPPMEADDGQFFMVEAKGGRPYAISADGNGQAQPTDLSLFSSHFFEGRRVIDWAWCRDPFLTLWVALDDGTLLAHCASPGSGVSAWTKHEITGGKVEALCSVPLGGEDIVYMVVRRGDVQHLERLAHRRVDDFHACHLDMASIGDDSNASKMTVTNYAAVGTNPYNFFITTELAAAVSVADKIVFYAPNGMPIYLTVTGVTGTAVTATADEYNGGGNAPPIPTVPYDVPAGMWGEYGATADASQFVDGTVVTAVVDGIVFPNLTVAAGQVEFPVAGVVRIVGLPFSAQMQALPIEQDRGKQKIVSKVRVEKIGQGGKVGASWQALQEFPPRQVSQGYGLLKDGFDMVELSVPASYDKTAIVMVEQSAPKPIKILAVEREYKLGD